MPQQILAHDLQKACQVLFNTDIRLKSDFFSSINTSILKNAYRKRAFETHPDRSRALGKNEDLMIKKFKEVTIAYEILKPVVGKDIQPRYSDMHSKKQATATQRAQKPSSSNSFTASPPRSNACSEKNKDNHYYKGPIPKIELPLNKFLYYAGEIPWKTYIDSIMWEKKQRPLFGQIAYEWKFLTNSQIKNILEKKVFPEKFGEYALREGLLTHFQHMAVLGRQRILEAPPGDFFIQQGIFTADHIKDLIIKAKIFNKNLRLNEK